MRQIARRLRDGRVELVDVPDPGPAPGRVLIRTEVSVISTGTERSTLEIARKGLLAKARARPEQVRQVLDRVRRDGLRSTTALVRRRLDELGPLGYSVAGTVIATGEEVTGIRPGDRVAAAGAGFANHAELDSVPARLCATVPESVASEEAAFATLGSIALHGFRRSEVQVGSRVAVIGLGLIGQLAVRIARAAGCAVLGVDVAEDRLELARAAGAEACLRSELSSGDRRLGSADAVLVCASASTSDPIELAAELARDRAPVVVVGDVDLRVPRAPYYEKELDLRLSRSSGPGRYDPDYELHGHDYPIGYVRWTEGRNMEAFLALVAQGRLRPSELISGRYPFSEAERAFEAVVSERSLAVALDYELPPDREGDGAKPSPGGPVERRSRPVARRAKPRIGLIGAGSFATGTIVPGLLDAGFEPGAVASAGGLSAADAGRRFGFARVAGDAEEVIGADEIDLVVIATQHDSHAALAASALSAGKPVYVEKPLALDLEGVRAIRDAQEKSGALLLVGFNRRHSPVAEELRDIGHPRLTTFRVNAGPLPRDHWTNDARRGGGRLLGEGCHFVDFLCDQAVSEPRAVMAYGFLSHDDMPIESTDNFSIQISFGDGSVGTVRYSANGPTGPAKERIEVSGPGTYAEVEDFGAGTMWRGRRQQRLGSRRRDKGFTAMYELFAQVVRGEADPPDADGYLVSTLATIAALRSLRTGHPEPVVMQANGP